MSHRAIFDDRKVALVYPTRWWDYYLPQENSVLFLFNLTVTLFHLLGILVGLFKYWKVTKMCHRAIFDDRKVALVYPPRWWDYYLSQQNLVTFLINLAVTLFHLRGILVGLFKCWKVTKMCHRAIFDDPKVALLYLPRWWDYYLSQENSVAFLKHLVVTLFHLRGILVGLFKYWKVSKMCHRTIFDDPKLALVYPSRWWDYYLSQENSVAFLINLVVTLFHLRGILVGLFKYWKATKMSQSHIWRPESGTCVLIPMMCLLPFSGEFSGLSN